MTSSRPQAAARTVRGPLHGFGPAELRALELHEAQAHVRADRQAKDLGDAILLHDPAEADPFLNRMSGLRLADDSAGFDRRLAELLVLFASLGRRPHVWLSPAFGTPVDLERRLAEVGFVDVGGTFAMVQVRPPGSPRPRDLPDGMCLRRLADAGSDRGDLIEGIASVLIEAFVTDAETGDSIVRDLEWTSRSSGDACLLAIDGVPVAAGRRYTADGVTYLSSIGTRSAHRGRGYASLVTSALVEDGRSAGGELVHLGVETGNNAALSMYRRLGFEIVGDRQADLLLT